MPASHTNLRSHEACFEGIELEILSLGLFFWCCGRRLLRSPLLILALTFFERRLVSRVVAHGPSRRVNDLPAQGTLWIAHLEVGDGDHGLFATRRVRGHLLSDTYPMPIHGLSGLSV